MKVSPDPPRIYNIHVGARWGMFALSLSGHPSGDTHPHQAQTSLLHPQYDDQYLLDKL